MALVWTDPLTHRAYDVVHKLEVAFSANDQQARERARLIVEELAREGMLVAAEIKPEFGGRVLATNGAMMTRNALEPMKHRPGREPPREFAGVR